MTRAPVTIETLTDEMVADWWNRIGPSERSHDHGITACDARGLTSGPYRRKPTDRERAYARQFICDAINARSKP